MMILRHPSPRTKILPSSSDWRKCCFPGMVARGRQRRRATTSSSISFAPPVFKHHMQCLDKSILREHLSDKKNPTTDIDKILSETSIQSSLQGLEKVVGIPATSAASLLQHFPSNESMNKSEWTERLETWSGVTKGRDVFIRGLGTFDITEIYERRARQLFKAFSFDLLYTVKSPPLQRAYKNAQKASSSFDALPPEPESNKVDDIRRWLASRPTFDVVDIFASRLDDDLDGILKAKGYCFSSDVPQFPPFVRYTIAEYMHRVYYQKTLDRELLVKCLYSGAMYTGMPYIQVQTWDEDDDLGPIPDGGARARIGTRIFPFWLVPVYEMQALGHFSKALDSNSEVEQISLFRHLSHILKQADGYPGKRHLIRHYDYWNDPDNIGSIDELVPHRNVHWPERWENMGPRQLLRALRELERQNIRGPNISYEYLKDLPDRGPMKVLRSSHEIGSVAEKLDNCAASLAEKVERKQIVFVALQDSSGKPIALGSHPLCGEWPKGGWSEIREADNGSPSEDTRKQFDNYTRTFRAWHKTAFSEMRRRDRARRLEENEQPPPISFVQ